MVLDKLGDSLKNTLQKIAKAVFVDDKLINELVKDIQRALLQSDVNVKLVFDLTKKIKDRAKEEKDVRGLTKKEQLINIVYEELVAFLGGEGHKIDVNKKPFKVMLVGLFGNGKTTTAGKLAKFFMKRGFKVALLGLDVHRPAAMDQLEQVGKFVNAAVFTKKGEKNALNIWKEYERELSKFDVVLVDTAGRDALSNDLIEELNRLNKAIAPDERLLIIGADVGQAAEKQAQGFHDACGVTGVIITKLDGTAKGGGALIACAVTKAPVKFVGVGEKADDLEEFKPKGFVSRMLGMGDLEALLEKTKEAYTEEEAQDLGKKFLKGEFNLIDLYEQMEAMSKMGSLSKLMEMIPGMSQLQLPKDMLQVQEGKLKKWRFIMDSMSKGELEDPEIVSASRIDRIAKGAGMSAGEVRELLKQYRQSKKMVKMFKGAQNPRQMEKMMKSMQGQGKFKFK
ncbi:signal recognition particle protein Srp54 [Candidatus Woesearchaeota archaeon]|nr:signal recognition particle protein Srp54 [Candidatus Woesearchaeota archaeon]